MSTQEAAFLVRPDARQSTRHGAAGPQAQCCRNLRVVESLPSSHLYRASMYAVRARSLLCVPPLTYDPPGQCTCACSTKPPLIVPVAPPTPIQCRLKLTDGRLRWRCPASSCSCTSGQTPGITAANCSLSVESAKRSVISFAHAPDPYTRCTSRSHNEHQPQIAPCRSCDGGLRSAFQCLSILAEARNVHCSD